MGKSSKLKQRKAEADEAAFKQRFSELSRAASFAPPEDPLINEFRGYASHFVRAPETFVLRTRSSDRSKQALEMARHLFGRFRVPRILEQVWATYINDRVPAARPLALRPRYLRNGDEAAPPPPRYQSATLNAIDFRAWFVCVATGGSLYKEHTRTILTKKETHTFLSAPSSLSLCQGLIYAVARCAGAEEGGALRLARSKLADRSPSPRWFDAVRFFCLPGNLPTTVAQTNDLVDFIASRFQEDATFRLLGSSQTLPAVLRRMEQWHRALTRAKDLSGVSWAGVDLSDHNIKLKDPDNKDLEITWNFHQITTGKELAAEGTAQRHCVFSYKANCVSGRCSIWSLSRIDAFGRKTRRLTIELTRDGNIVQKRGLANRIPRPEEEHVVSLWAREMRLSNDRRY